MVPGEHSASDTLILSLGNRHFCVLGSWSSQALDFLSGEGRRVPQLASQVIGVGKETVEGKDF